MQIAIHKLKKAFIQNRLLIFIFLIIFSIFSAGCGYKEEIEHLKSEIGQIKGELQKTEESIAIFSKDLSLVKNDIESIGKDLERLNQKFSNEKQQNIQNKAKPRKKKKK